MPIGEIHIENKSIDYYALRGVRYALASMFALFAGYLVASKWVHREDVCLLIAHFIFTLPFFISYMCRFAEIASDGESLKAIRRNQGLTLGVVIVYGVLIFVIGLLLYYYLANHFPPLTLTVAILAHASLFLAYGFFLFFRATLAEHTLIRHTLVWPVILSIGTPFYLGLSWADFLAGNAAPLLPLGIFVIFFVVAESFKFTMKQFLWCSVSVLVIFGVVGFRIRAFRLTAIGLLFAVFLAAYVGVFEGWGLTAIISQTNPAKAARYYKALFGALLGSGLTIPLLYIGTSFSALFVFGYLVHFLLAFTVWYRASPSYMNIDRWLYVRSGMVMLLLALLAWDALYPSGRTFQVPLVNDLLAGSVFALTIAILGASSKRVFLEWKRRGFGLFDRKTHILGAVPLMALPGLIASYVIVQKSPANQGPASQVHSIYLLVIIISLVALFVIRGKRGGILHSAATSALGVALAARLFTSSVVGAMILIPEILIGKTLISAIWSSSPFFFSAVGGFCLNDVCDRAQDSINKPYRAIPSGRLTSQTVLTISLSALAASACLTIVGDLTVLEKLLQTCVLVGIVLYNWVVRQAGVVKGVYTALLATIPFVYVGASAHRLDVTVGFAICVLFFMTGRELLMDSVDVSGDLSAGIATLPTIIGVRAAQLLGFGCLYIGLASMAWWARYAHANHGLLFLAVAAALVITATATWLGYSSSSIRRTINTALWAPMLVGVSLFVAETASHSQ